MNGKREGGERGGRGEQRRERDEGRTLEPRASSSVLAFRTKDEFDLRTEWRKFTTGEASRGEEEEGLVPPSFSLLEREEMSSSLRFQSPSHSGSEKERKRTREHPDWERKSQTLYVSGRGEDWEKREERRRGKLRRGEESEEKRAED